MYMLTTRLYQMAEAVRCAREAKQLALLDRGAVGDTLFALYNHAVHAPREFVVQSLSLQRGDIDDEDMRVYASVCAERLPLRLASNVSGCRPPPPHSLQTLCVRV
jgi:hypothetical protein